jgi:hypothetical protein
MGLEVQAGTQEHGLDDMVYCKTLLYQQRRCSPLAPRRMEDVSIYSTQLRPSPGRMLRGKL